MEPIRTEDWQRARDVLAAAKRVAVLTGAGVSAESGVPTFRASDGLWEGHRIEDVATPMGFRRDPRLVWKFYNERRANVGRVQPNPGHLALARMEDKLGAAFTLVTQNVDGLHQTAGNQNVLEIHGSLHRTRCTICAEVRSLDTEPLSDLPSCRTCGGLMRPDIVWFHEPLPEEIWMRAMEAAAMCDALLVVGTSAVVYPAASLIPIAQQSGQPGATILEFNLTRTEASTKADIGLYGPSGQTLPELLRLLGW